MTCIYSSKERIAATPSGETLATLATLALGSATVVAVAHDHSAAVSDQPGNLVTPAILALVSASSVAFSRALPDRGAVLSAATALIAAAVMATVLGPNQELASFGRLLGGLGFGALAAIAAERSLHLAKTSRAGVRGVLGIAIATGIVAALSTNTLLAALGEQP